MHVVYDYVYYKNTCLSKRRFQPLSYVANGGDLLHFDITRIGAAFIALPYATEWPLEADYWIASEIIET